MQVWAVRWIFASREVETIKLCYPLHLQPSRISLSSDPYLCCTHSVTFDESYIQHPYQEIFMALNICLKNLWKNCLAPKNSNFSVSLQCSMRLSTPQTLCFVWCLFGVVLEIEFGALWARPAPSQWAITPLVFNFWFWARVSLNSQALLCVTQTGLKTANLLPQPPK